MMEFKLNEYISLKLEDNKTNIYIKGEQFKQCKFLLLYIPVDEITSFDRIDSIDEAAERLGKSLEIRNSEIAETIPPETEFWGHCSNLQAWIEYGYDTRLLHRDLSFPMLKRLTDVGDTFAKRAFKEELAKRIESGFPPVIIYLLNENYLDYFTIEEIRAIEINPDKEKEFKKIIDIANSWYHLGYRYDDERQCDKSFACFENSFKYLQKAIEMDPDNDIVWNLLGNVYYFKGEHDKEYKCYDKSIEINPNYAEPWYNKACLESKRNNFIKLFKFLKKAIKLNESFKLRAKNDPDLEKVKEMIQFKALVKST